MIHEVEISPEIVKLAQSRTRKMGSMLSDELARSVVQEAIYTSDDENGLMLDEGDAYSNEDALVAAFGVNDIVVNGCRVDVRTVDEDGRVAINRALVNTSYMRAGTLAVQMNGTLNGKVVGYIPASAWEQLEKTAGDQQTIYLSAKSHGDFDLIGALSALAPTQTAPANKAVDAFELATFVANRGELPIVKQRALVEGALGNPESWPQVERAVADWSKGQVRRILSDSGVWNFRMEATLDILEDRFKKVNRAEIKKIVAKMGESFGGQPESPEFRRTLLSTLAQEELSRSLAGSTLAKAKDVADAVLSGRAVTDAVKDLVRNPVAVQIATQIKRSRQNVADFMDASAQELAGAFQQLALQPAYATHSADPQSGLDSINEALKIVEAAELARLIREADEELASL